MENPNSLELILGTKTYQVRVLNLIQQRAIGSALFKVPTPPQDPNDPTKVDLTHFDFDAEFNSAVSIVFAAINRENPTASPDKWLSEMDASFQDLQQTKAKILQFAGYIRTRPAAAAMPDPSPV